MTDDPKVKYLLNQSNWQAERRKLRDILLDCGLEERVKWGKLCYAYEDSNVVIIYGMKTSCALGFFKGSLLKGEDGVLVQPGKHSQAMRRLHFESLEEIEGSEDTIRCFVGRALVINCAIPSLPCIKATHLADQNVRSRIIADFDGGFRLQTH
ncbi:protein of unknown function (DU1801) [Paracoccus halophilus]|uniref:YdhG-like domain-containing protein n=1 Tax=Paracoccus halophilus TaxID=376733 RepID=A0A1I0UEG9_9RHOB|nr:DUF1801 domain-containing protein [Paracoccus halophilus]SFA62425.1 protein of unknown function (DU1801) [Paracoccus halophilus]